MPFLTFSVFRFSQFFLYRLFVVRTYFLQASNAFHAILRFIYRLDSFRTFHIHVTVVKFYLSAFTAHSIDNLFAYRN